MILRASIDLRHVLPSFTPESLFHTPVLHCFSGETVHSNRIIDTWEPKTRYPKSHCFAGRRLATYEAITLTFT